MERNWLQLVKVDWAKIFVVDDESVLHKHSQVFKEGIGTLTGFQAKIVVDHTTTTACACATIAST